MFNSFNHNNMSPIGKLQSRDFQKALAVSVLVAVLSFAKNLLEAKGFDLSSADAWEILNVTITATLGYLSKNILTDENDKLGGKL